MKLSYLQFLCVFLYQASTVRSECAMTQTCIDPNCYLPNIPEPTSDTTPQVYNYTMANPACPNYVGKEACCNNNQMKLMATRFFLLNSTFGPPTGCTICSANMQAFWCEFTCSPNQADFMAVGNLTKYNGNTYRDIYINVGSSSICELWGSCSKVPAVTEEAGMSTPIGFINFQAEQGAPISKTMIHATAKVDGSDTLSMEFNPCNSSFPGGKDDKGFTLGENCECNTCQLSCASGFDWNAMIQEPGLFTGLNIRLIIGTCAAIILETLICSGIIIYKRTLKESRRSQNINEAFLPPEQQQ